MLANIEALENQVDAKGRKLESVRIPVANDAVACGDKFCNSYVNSCVVNGGIIMPCCGVSTDDAAREVIQEYFPDRRIVQILIYASRHYTTPKATIASATLMNPAIFAPLT